MSPNVGNFVHDLVEMAKAMETLPQVQAELDQANAQIEAYAKQVQRLEMIAIERKTEMDNLYSRIRSLEVERDDASFRVLEAEDLAHNTLSRLRAIQTALGGTVDALDPPKPEPVKEYPDPQGRWEGWPDAPPQAQPVATPAEGQSASDPTTNANVGEQKSEQTSATSSANGGVTLPNAVNSIQDVGQSVSPPTTASASSHSEGSAPTQATSTDAGRSEGVTSDKPYLGKRYFDISGYVSRYDWEQGGGTEEDYDWRPTPPIASDSY